MKFYSLVLLFILIVSINSDCDHEKGTKAKDCQNKLTDDDKKKEGYSYCCYLKTESAEGCIGLDKSSYDNIKDTIKELEKVDEIKKVKKLDCHSLFLKFGFLNILLFLL